MGCSLDYPCSPGSQSIAKMFKLLKQPVQILLPTPEQEGGAHIAFQIPKKILLFAI